MNEKIDEADYWKGKALAAALDLAKERFEAQIAHIVEKYKIRPGVDALNDNGTITRGPADEVK